MRGWAGFPNLAEGEACQTETQPTPLPTWPPQSAQGAGEQASDCLDMVCGVDSSCRMVGLSAAHSLLTISAGRPSWELAAGGVWAQLLC
jgi:hypothetical protein